MISENPTIAPEGGLPAGEAGAEKPEKSSERPAEKSARKKIVFVEAGSIASEQARDVAEGRLTETAEKMKGFTGFFRKIWHQNLAYEYRRQKEIKKVKKEISEKDNIFASETADRKAHEQTMGALVERFSGEYEELVHTELGEKKPEIVEAEIKKQVQDLVRSYAMGEIDEANFKEERKRILARLKGVDTGHADVRLKTLEQDYKDGKLDKKSYKEQKKQIEADFRKGHVEVAEQGYQYADNLFEVAKEVRQAVEHGQKIEEIDLDFNVTVGKAKSGVRTEAQFNTVDRIIDKIHGKSWGLINETTIAIAYTALLQVPERLGRSKIAAWFTFGGSALLGGGIAGLREKKRVEEERRLHFREMAKGITFDTEKSPRRKEMEEYRYETREANDLADALENSLYIKKEGGARELRDLTQKELETVMAHLSEIESRISLSDRHRIDLISYSDTTRVAQEQLRLDLLRAQAKVDIRKILNKEAKIVKHGPEFDYKLEGVIGAPDIKKYLESQEMQDLKDREAKQDKLAYWIMGRRMEKGFVIEDIEKHHGAFTEQGTHEYAKWDFIRAGEILDAMDASEYTDEKLLGKGLNIPAGQSLEDFLQSLKDTRIKNLLEGDKGIENKDRLFSKMRNNRAWKKAMWGVGIGLAVGAVAQEGAAFFTHQEGLVEGWVQGRKGEVPAGGEAHYTPLEALRRWWSQDYPHVAGGNLREVILDPNHKIFFPEGIDLRFNKFTDKFELLRGGKVLNSGIDFNEDGGLTDASKKALAEQGILIRDPQTTSVVTEKMVESRTGNRLLEEHKDYILDNSHRISRGPWLENDTPTPDGNELKLMGDFQQDGTYRFSVDHMTPDGSKHAGLSPDVRALMAEGKLKILLSMSRGTQNQVFEVNIDSTGHAIINPNTELGKIFIGGNGTPKFMAKFSEVAEVTGAKGAAERVQIFATAVGEGLDTSPETITNGVEKVTEQFTSTRWDLPADWRMDPPFIIPLVGRKPLEPAESKKLAERTATYYGYEGMLARESYRERMSPKILENKNIDLSGDDSAMVKEYLDKQNQSYLKELTELLQGTKPMNNSVETVIAIPSYQEGSNLEKTLRNYAKLKNRDGFEIVVLENHPRDKDRDNSAGVMEKIKKEYPDLQLTHLYKEYDHKPFIGEVRKNLADAVLLRKQQAGINKSIAIVSNDADMEDISENYANDIADTFKKNRRLDALAGQWDFPPESFKQYPLFHATQRLWHYFTIAFRYNYLNSPELSGCNSAFRSGIYAAIGGYNEKSNLGEDLEMGWMIKEARGYDAGRLTYLNRAWLITNPRRTINKMLSGDRFIEQHKDFHVNEGVRKTSLEKILREKKDFSDEDFGKEVQSIYSFYDRMKKSKSGWIEDVYVDKSFDRAMRFLGVTYTTRNGEVVIGDMAKMKRGLENYQNK